MTSPMGDKFGLLIYLLYHVLEWKKTGTIVPVFVCPICRPNLHQGWSWGH